MSREKLIFVKNDPKRGVIEQVTMIKEFVVSALVHGVVFALFMLAGNWIWHWGMGWAAFVVSGLLFGVVMAGLDRFLEKRKKK